MFIKDEGGEWAEVLEKMKEINFFPYSITDPVKMSMEGIEPKREGCSSDNHCGKC